MSLTIRRARKECKRLYEEKKGAGTRFPRPAGGQPRGPRQSFFPVEEMATPKSASPTQATCGTLSLSPRRT